VVTELLTVAEVMARLRVCRRTVEREIKSGRLRALHIGRRTFVTHRELDAYLAAAAKKGRAA
jgi:excisionase family DNA binding protein